MKITLRKPLISDARRYLEILKHPEFHYIPAKPKTLKEEKDFLRKLQQRMKNGTEYSFAIIANGKHIGGCGMILDQQMPYICEVGYFIDRKYWGKGIATRAVRLLEKFVVENLNSIVRIQLHIAKENIGSQKVAIKSGYKKEGNLKKYLKVDDIYYDCYLYAKILK